MPIFDLALKKYVITTPSYAYNQVITFGIKVFNQGNTTASDFEITDYIPSGYQLADANWTLSGSQAKRMITTDLLPGDSTIVQINLRIVMTNGGEMNWDNYAEISRTSDSGGDNTNEDADSNQDQILLQKIMSNQIQQMMTTSLPRIAVEKKMITIQPE